MVVPQPQAISKKKPISINYHVFKDANIQGIPEAVGATRPSTRIFWITVVIITNLACFFHLYYLLQTFEREDNETTITFGEVEQLIPPRVIVCQRSTRMLDYEKVKDVKAEDYLALELGLGLVHFESSDEIKQKMENKSIKERYLEILKEHDGSISTAYDNFHRKYMRRCEDVFHECYIELYTKVKCCDIFEPIFTIYGTCFVTKSNSILINQTDSMANFLFRLNFNGTQRPDFFNNKKSNDADEVFNAADSKNKKNNMEKYYDIGFVDGLDQGNFFVHHQYVAKGEWLTVNMVQKRRMLIEDEGACVPNDRVNSELDFFREYTRTNCKWERALMKRTILQGEHCELPLVELLKPGYKSKSICNLTQILDFYDSPIKTGNQDKDDDTTAPASPESSFFSVLRKSCALERLYLKYLEKFHNDTLTCLPLCDTTLHGLTMEKIVDSTHLRPNEASITLQYTTKEVEKVIESPPGTISEYFALIGGTIGMWNGASIVALGHFIVLSVGAFDIRGKIQSFLSKFRKREPENTKKTEKITTA
uniref:Uncharacterized protein n=1 Tax=Plectus sambesii TaxID=2011161 RepID=A0A914W5I4_9BILA